MALDLDDVRLRLMGHLIPVAARNSIHEPEKLVEICRTLEKYVLESPPTGEVTPDSPTRQTLRMPRKEKQSRDLPEFMTPPHGGQVDASPR